MKPEDFLNAPPYRGGPIAYVIGSPGGDVVCPGSKRYFCARCTAPVWFARSGQKRLSTTGAKPLCMDCFDTMPDDDKEVFKPTAAEIASDILGEN